MVTLRKAETNRAWKQANAEHVKLYRLAHRDAVEDNFCCPMGAVNHIQRELPSLRGATVLISSVVRAWRDWEDEQQRRGLPHEKWEKNY